MIPAPVQFAADLTLYAGLGICGAFGLACLAIGIRHLIDSQREPRRAATEQTTMEIER